MLDGSEHPSWLDKELKLQLYQQPHLDKILTVFRSVNDDSRALSIQLDLSEVTKIDGDFSKGTSRGGKIQGYRTGLRGQMMSGTESMSPDSSHAVLGPQISPCN